MCAATGYYTDATGKVPFVVNSAGGVWGAPIPIPGLRGSSIGSCELNIWGNNCPTGRSVSCSSTVLCIAVGNTYVADDAPNASR